MPSALSLCLIPIPLCVFPQERQQNEAWNTPAEPRGDEDEEEEERRQPVQRPKQKIGVAVLPTPKLPVQREPSPEPEEEPEDIYEVSGQVLRLVARGL